MKMEEYTRRRQNTVMQYITKKSLLDLCEGLERELGARVGVWWWEKEEHDLAGEREVAAAAA